MKTLRILIIAITLLYAGRVMGQSQIGGITITKPSIEKVNELVTVEFTAKSDKKTVKRNYSLLFAPAITDGTYVWSLPPVIVSGRGGKVSLDRQIYASGRQVVFDNAVFTKAGQTIRYSASVPYQEWMEGAKLTMEALSVGCCSESPLVSQVMADDLKLQPTIDEYADLVAEKNKQLNTDPVITEEPALEPQGPVSTGEKLAESYPFIAAAEDYKPIAPGELYNEDREGTIKVQFAVGSFKVDRSFGNNEQSVTDLMSSIRIIENSADSRVKKITVAGFSSPEGSYTLNDRLAWDRAVAMKEYILEHSDLKPDQVEIYKGSVDWQGLRMLIEESDMSWKEKALDIIDKTPVWDAKSKSGRHGALQRLDSGAPYRYMKANYFPKLRNAAYIKLYHENK